MTTHMEALKIDQPKRRGLDPYEELANAIVIQAVDDYKSLKSGRIPYVSEETQVNMNKEDVYKIIFTEKQKILKFFKSKWYATLTTLKPDVLIQRLETAKYHKWKPRYEYANFNCKYFQQLCKEHGYGIAFICKSAKISHDVIFKLGRYKKRMVRLATIQKIEKALNLESGSLILEEK